MSFNPINAWVSIANMPAAPGLHVAPLSLKPHWPGDPWAPRTITEIHDALIPATNMIARRCRENRLAIGKFSDGLLRHNRNVLNLRGESRRSSAVTIRAIA